MCHHRILPHRAIQLRMQLHYLSLTYMFLIIKLNLHVYSPHLYDSNLYKLF